MNKEEDTCVLYYNNHKAASERKKRRDLMRYVYSKDDFKATYFVHADGEKKNGSVAALFNFLDTKSPIETIGKNIMFRKWEDGTSELEILPQFIEKNK